MSGKPTPVNQIPGTVRMTDAEGRETEEAMSWQVLPPAKDRCQICNYDHLPMHPHNPETMYYKMTFKGMVGRVPTWADALAHCDEMVKKIWEIELRATKNWTEPPEGERPVKHCGIDP